MHYFHIVCCLGMENDRKALCGGDAYLMVACYKPCTECKRLELIDDFCPRHEAGCEAVREGQVDVKIKGE